MMAFINGKIIGSKNRKTLISSCQAEPPTRILAVGMAKTTGPLQEKSPKKGP